MSRSSVAARHALRAAGRARCGRPPTSPWAAARRRSGGPSSPASRLAAPLGEHRQAAVGGGARARRRSARRPPAGTSGSATPTRAARPRRRASAPAGRCRHCRAGWRRHAAPRRPARARRSPAHRPRSPAAGRGRPRASSASAGRQRRSRSTATTSRAGSQQRAGQAAGAGADLIDASAPSSVPGIARDPVEQLLVEQEILAERLARAEPVPRDHLAQRRQTLTPSRLRRARRGASPGHADRRDHRAGLGEVLAGDVEGGAVVGRGADDRQAERDVDALVEMRAS